MPTPQTAQWPFEWQDLHDRLEATRAREKKRCESLVWYLGPASEFCKRVVGDGRSPANGPRPQDHLAVGISIHAFRTALGSVELTLGGMADAAVPLNRSLWEMQLRAFNVRENGELGALACFIYEAEQEIAVRELEITNEWGDVDRHHNELAAWREWRQQLADRVAAAGFDPKEVQRHGKLNFAEVARASQQVEAYKTLYVRHSLIAHGSASSTLYANLGAGDLITEEGGMLLPIEYQIPQMVGDALVQLLACLFYAAQIVRDATLVRDVRHAVDELQEAWVELVPALRPRSS